MIPLSIVATSQSNMKRNSASHQRSIKAYLKPKNHTIVKGMAQAEGLSVSEVINMIVTNYSQRLPERDRVKYLNHFINGGTLHKD